MWIMASFGILMPSLRPEGTVPPGDDRLIQVRARRARDLQIFRSDYCPELGDIIEIPYSDYEYRAYCTHEQLAAAMARLAMDVDFVKFKPTTETKYHDKQLHGVYNRIWSLLFGAISTDAHRRRYLQGPPSHRRPTGTRAQRGQQSLNWYDDLPSVDDEMRTLGQLVGTAHSTDRDDERELIDAVPTSWDAELAEAERDAERIVRRTDGSIDHSECSHGSGRNARRRCQRRNTSKRR